MRRASVSVLLVLLATCPAAADELTDRLESLPGFTVIEERPHPRPPYRHFILEYRQQVNHDKPWKGTFTQRVVLSHISEDAPTVLVTEGYNVSLGTERSQVTQIVVGNQVRIEHRFFEPSRPDPADWRDLTIFQAATDHHSIVTTLKGIYDGAWLATGDSKSGMASVYFRRFYPDDVRGTIAYVAPHDVIDGRDRYIEFLDNVGDDPACRAALEEVQRQALIRRDEITRMMVEQAELHGFTFDQVFGTPKLALELVVLETPFVFWQYGAQSFCDLVPPPEATTEEIFSFLDGFVGFLNYTDQILGDIYAPFFFQAATQLGYPTIKDSHLKDLLLFPGAEVASTFVPPEIAIPPFDEVAMMDIDLFVRLRAQRMMFIYGEIDPWSAEPFRIGLRARDSFVYIAPDANHGVHIGLLPQEQAAEAVATIRRWAGLPEAAALHSVGVPEPELEREQLNLRPRL